jgi:hypothetical protein
MVRRGFIGSDGRGTLVRKHRHAHATVINSKIWSTGTRYAKPGVVDIALN